MPRLLCRRDRQKYSEDCCAYPKSTEGRQVRRPNNNVRENVARLRSVGKDDMQEPVRPTRHDALFDIFKHPAVITTLRDIKMVINQFKIIVK